MGGCLWGRGDERVLAMRNAVDGSTVICPSTAEADGRFTTFGVELI